MKITLKYSIEKNNYNNLHYAVIHAKTESFQSFIDTLKGEFDEEMLQALYDKMLRFISDNVLEGNSLVFEDLFTVQPVIKGKFSGKDDEFDPSRHRLDIKISPAKSLSGVQNLDNYKFKKADGAVRRKRP